MKIRPKWTEEVQKNLSALRRAAEEANMAYNAEVLLLSFESEPREVDWNNPDDVIQAIFQPGGLCLYSTYTEQNISCVKCPLYALRLDGESCNEAIDRNPERTSQIAQEMALKEGRL
jgi:hypothetical protein